VVDGSPARRFQIEIASGYGDRLLRIPAYNDGVRMVERFDYRDFYSGLIRLHVLHHAAKGAIFGLGMIDELRRHG